MTEPSAAPDTLEVARHVAALADERRATDIVILDVRTLVDYTDFFVLATGQSARQNQAIAEHVVKTMKGERRYAISKAGLDTGSWICLDLGSVVVHVFDPETRARYDLELLWSDAPRVSRVAPAPEPEPAAKPARRRRVTRQAAVVDADAGNAPDSARPPEGEPEAEERPKAKAKKAPARKPAKRATGKPAAGRSAATRAPRRRKASD